MIEVAGSDAAENWTDKRAAGGKKDWGEEKTKTGGSRITEERIGEAGIVAETGDGTEKIQKKEQKEPVLTVQMLKYQTKPQALQQTASKEKRSAWEKIKIFRQCPHPI